MNGTGRPCSVCDDPRRPAIEAELRSPARKSYPMLADSFRPLSSQAIRRHHLSHMAEGLAPAMPLAAEATEPGTTSAPGDLVQFGRQLEAMTLELIKEVAQDGDFRDVANALRVGLQTHERLLRAYAARPPEFDPLRDATITAIRDLVAGALEDEPVARAKVLAAFRKVGAGSVAEAAAG